MSDLARQIMQHSERHALAWDADRRRSAWNGKLWHERFMAQYLGRRGASISAAVPGGRLRAI